MYSQEKSKRTSPRTFNEVYNTEVRGRNALSLAAGSAIANGDYADALYEIYLHIGYKRFIGPYININFGYNKYNLAFKDVFNEGFMSFDANLEFVPFPKGILSPYFLLEEELTLLIILKEQIRKFREELVLKY